MWIGIVLMPIRIRIRFGIKMDIPIRIDIKTMPIRNTDILLFLFRYPPFFYLSFFCFCYGFKFSGLLCFPTFRYSPMPDFSGGGGGGKTGGKAAAGGRILPFHDEVEDSDEERGFMKPYSDNPRAASNYKDDDK